MLKRKECADEFLFERRFRERMDGFSCEENILKTVDGLMKKIVCKRGNLSIIGFFFKDRFPRFYIRMDKLKYCDVCKFSKYGIILASYGSSDKYTLDLFTENILNVFKISDEAKLGKSANNL